jgi:Ca2+-transporting ATPase
VRHSIPADRVSDITTLMSRSAAGLDAAEVAVRRARHGSNAIVQPERGRWRELARDTLRDPMLWLLAGAAVLYAAVGEGREAIVLAAAVVPLVFMDGWLHRRTHLSTRGLQKRLASRATVLRDATESVIPAEDLVPGDLARVTAGEWFPADGLIVRGEELQADESSLTGESFPVRKQAVGLPLDPAIDGLHWGFAGTRLLAGDARVRIVTTGAETLYGEIVRSAQAGVRPRTPMQQAIGRLVLVLVVAAVLACILLAAARLAQGHGMTDALLSAVTLAVVAIPEEFPVVFTFFLGVGVYRLARRQALVRRAVAVENIGRVSCLCVDKTGTLTEGRLRLAHRMAVPGIAGTELVRVAALASRAESHDPVDTAILEAAGAQRPAGERVALFPFTENRRRETAVYRELPGSASTGRLIACKGAPETVLVRCRMHEALAADWRHEADELAKTHRVIACASRICDDGELPDEEPDRDLEFAGLLAFEDPVREGAAEAVQRAKHAGLRLIMVTGDHPAYALAIARELGIAQQPADAVLGEEFDDVSATGDERMDGPLAVVARAFPAHKLALVRALQRAGEVVAVTGDGVNDVPALRAADVGIAMGRDATQSAREAAAIVLLDDNLRTIVDAVAEGRQLARNLRMSFAYLLAAHIPLVISAALIPLAGYPLLYLPIHLVWLEIIFHPTAMLGFQAPADLRPGASDRPLVRFFGAREWIGILGTGLLTGAAVVAGYLLALARGGEQHARALALVVLIAAGAATAAALTRLATHAVRSILGATIGSALLFTLWQPAATLLGLEPPHAGEWLLAAAAGLAVAAPILLLQKPGVRHARIAAPLRRR